MADETTNFILRFFAETKDVVSKRPELEAFLNRIEKFEDREHVLRVIMATDAKAFETAMDQFISKLGLSRKEAESFRNNIQELRQEYVAMSASVGRTQALAPPREVLQGYANLTSHVRAVREALVNFTGLPLTPEVQASIEKLIGSLTQAEAKMFSLSAVSHGKPRQELDAVEKELTDIFREAEKLRETLKNTFGAENVDRSTNNLNQIQSQYDALLQRVQAYAATVQEATRRGVAIDTTTAEERVNSLRSQMAELFKLTKTSPEFRGVIDENAEQRMEAYIIDLERGIQAQKDLSTAGVGDIRNTALQRTTELTQNLTNQIKERIQHERQSASIALTNQQAKEQELLLTQKGSQLTFGLVKIHESIATKVQQEIGLLQEANRLIELGRLGFQAEHGVVSNLVAGLEQVALTQRKAAEAGNLQGLQEQNLALKQSLELAERGLLQLRRSAESRQALIALAEQEIQKLKDQKAQLQENLRLQQQARPARQSDEQLKKDEERQGILRKQIEERDKEIEAIQKQISAHRKLLDADEQRLSKLSNSLNLIDEATRRTDQLAEAARLASSPSFNIKSLDDLADKLKEGKITLEQFAKGADKGIQDLNNMRRSIEGNATSVDKYRERIQNLTGRTVEGATVQERAGNAIRILGESATNATNKLKAYNIQLQRTAITNADLASAINNTNERVKDFNFFMDIAIQKIIRYRIAFRALQKGIQAIKSTFSVATDIEEQMSRLRVVLIGTQTDFNKLGQDALGMAFQFGRAINDVIDIMFVWAQQGKTQNEIMALTEATLFGVVGAGLEATQAVEALTSASRVYNIEAEDSIILFDKLLGIQKEFAVTAQDLADAIKVLGATANVVGIGMDELLAQVTAIAQVTRKTGKAVANSLKTIFSRFSKKETINAFRDINVAILETEGGLRPLGAVLQDLALKWDTLTEQQRVNIARTIGGIRRYADFIVLMDQFGVVLDAQRKAFDAAGLSNEALAERLNITANRIIALQNTFRSISKFIGETNVGLKSIFDVVSGVAELFTDAEGNLNLLGKAFAVGTSVLIAFGGAFLGLKAIQVGATLVTNRLKNSQIDYVASMITAESTIDALKGKTNEQIVSFLAEAGILQDVQRELAKTGGATVTFTEIEGTLGITVRQTNRDLLQQAATVKGLGVSAAGAGAGLTGAGAGARLASSGFASLFTKFNTIALVISAALTVVGLLGSKFAKFNRVIEDLSLSLKEQVRQQREHIDFLERQQRATLLLTSVANRSISTLLDETKSIEDKNIALKALQNTIERLETITGKTFITVSDIENLETARELQQELLDLGIETIEKTKAQRTEFDKIVEQRREQLEREKDIAKFLEIVEGRFKRATEAQAALSEIVATSTKQELEALLDTIFALEDLSLGEIRNRTDSVKEAMKGLDKETGEALLTFISFTRESKEFEKEWIDALRNVGETDEDFKKIVEDAIIPTLKNVGETGGIILVDQIRDALSKVGTLDFEAGDLVKSFDPATTVLGKFIGSTEALDAATGALGNQVAKTNRQILEETESLNRDAILLSESFAESYAKTFEEVGKIVGQSVRTMAEGIVEFREFQETITETSKNLFLLDRGVDVLEEMIDAESNLQKSLRESVALLKERIEFEKIEQEVQEERRRIGEIATTEELNSLIDDLISKKEQLSDLEKQREIFLRGSQDITGTEQQIADTKQAISELGIQSLEIAGRLEFTTGSVLDAVKLYIQSLQDGNLELGEMGEKLGVLLDALKELRKAEEAGLLNRETEITQLEKELRVMKIVADIRIKESKERLRVLLRQKIIEQQILQSNTQTLELQRARLDGALEAVTQLGKEYQFINDFIQEQLVNIDATIGKQDVLLALLREHTFTDKEREEFTRKIRQETGDLTDLTKELLALAKSKGVIDSDTVEKVEAQLAAEEAARISAIKTLGIRNRIRETIETGNKLIDDRLKKTEQISRLETGLAEITGEKGVAALQRQLKAIDESTDLEKKRADLLQGVIIDSLRKAEIDEAQANNLINRIQLANRLFEEEAKNRKFEEKVNFILEQFQKVREVTIDIASDFATTIPNALDLIVERQQDIFDIEEDIRDKEFEIAQLRKRLSVAASEDDLNVQQEIRAEITRAKEELREMKDELDDISTSSKLIGDIFGELANNVADTIIKINTEQLEQDLISVLTSSGIAERIAAGIGDGADRAAAKLAIKMKNAIVDASDTMNLELDATFLRGAGYIQGAIAGGFDFTASDATGKTLKNILSGGVQEGISPRGGGSGFASFGAFVLPANAVAAAFNSVGTSVDAQNANFDTLTETLDAVNEKFNILNTQLDALIAGIGGAQGAAGELGDAGKKASDAQKLAASLIRGVGVIAATSIAGGATPSKARGAATGAVLGEATTQILLAQFASTINPLLGAAIGTFGALLGGQVGKAVAKSDRRQALIEDEILATQENTDAVSKLTVTMEDIRSELINAPARFTLPAQTGFGSGNRFGGDQLIINLPSGGGASRRASDPGFAQEVAEAVSNIYNRQGRRQGFSARLF